ncbi:pentatricopeptide repeat-containing protein At2g22410, mitochondrial-like [Pistacia vera]|uniref:pentatricopeptide repeat-containing protein At2g22410, mitochondrial-like n=1 Tax=Pistacia vera TaxID=55513 RepID=UPI00126386D9|nr:pentatricopeptide repeat-containing protein At2g22410, mitochondrial-like [Pistacia vera]
MKLARHIKRQFTTSSTNPKLERISKKIVSINSVKELHAQLIRTRLHKDPFSVSHVIKSYALSESPSYLHKAHLVFNQLERPTLLVFNHMIRGFSQSDQPNKAIDMYNNMYHQGLAGDNLTFIFVFKACARVKDVFHGQKFHAHATKLGVESYLFVSNALIHTYALCADLGFAHKLFDQMCNRDLVSWNSLICGYSQCNKFEEVLGLFNSMQEANIKADAVTMVKVILACIYLGSWCTADSMVKYIEENNIEIDVYLGNTLIDMYGRRGLVDLARETFNQMRYKNVVSWNAVIKGYVKVMRLVEAQKLFDMMPRRDVISWTSMITGYSQANQFAEAIKLFREMMFAKVKPDEITVASVLSACAHLGSLDVGEAIHEYIQRHGIKSDIYVGNSLIDMYCKCGVVEKALVVFHEMKKKDSVSWTSVISGLAVNGFADYAIELFTQMLREGVRPTHGTFVGILLACSHAGMVDEGLKFFGSMKTVYGLTPEMKHYGCVVDLLSRSGNLERAYEFMKAMPIDPDVVVWRILLSACKLHGNLVLAEIATNKLLELDPSNSGNYILLSNTYAGSDRWDDAQNIRELMKEIDVLKPSGWSSIEVNGITT